MLKEQGVEAKKVQEFKYLDSTVLSNQKCGGGEEEGKLQYKKY